MSVLENILMHVRVIDVCFEIYFSFDIFCERLAGFAFSSSDLCIQLSMNGPRLSHLYTKPANAQEEKQYLF